MGVIYVRSFYVKLIDYGSFFSPLAVPSFFFFFLHFVVFFVCLFVCLYAFGFVSLYSFVFARGIRM